MDDDQRLPADQAHLVERVEGIEALVRVLAVGHVRPSLDPRPSGAGRDA